MRFIKAQKAAFSSKATLPLGQAGGAQEGSSHVGCVRLSPANACWFIYSFLSCFFTCWPVQRTWLVSLFRFQSMASTQILRWIPRTSAPRSTLPPREDTRTSAMCWCRYGGSEPLLLLVLLFYFFFSSNWTKCVWFHVEFICWNCGPARRAPTWTCAMTTTGRRWWRPVRTTTWRRSSTCWELELIPGTGYKEKQRQI